MKRQWVLLLGTLALIAVMLAGCSATDKRLIGAWSDTGGTTQYTFYKNGTFSVTMASTVSVSGTYEVKGDILTLFLPETEGSKEMGFSFFGDTTLVLESPYGSGKYANYTRSS